MNSKCLLYNKVKKKNPALWICMSLNKHKYTNKWSMYEAHF